ncbi:MAG: Gfo/Idh/MocA family oxidoreductase, partial [Pirellulales bacterium]|nr:Gfo/Idh/MocA family oxidoreductase [Pirellulales bacterium]
VVVPDHLHYQVAKDLLNAGIHTLLVKPFVPRLAEGLELVELAARQDCIGMVEFHKRWDQSNLLLRDRLAAGEIGDPLYFHIEYSQRRSIPEETFSKWVSDTNIFQYLGVHYVDMIWFLTGAWPLRVMSIGQKSRLVSRGIDAHDAIQTVVEWRHEDRTFVSTHLTNWIDPKTTSAMSDQTIKVIGTDGRIECDQKHRGVQVVTEAGIEDVNPYFSQFAREVDGSRRFAGYGYDSIRAFLGDVSDVNRDRREVSDLEGARPTFRSALVSTAVVEASNASLEHGGEWVTIDASLEERVRDGTK